METKQSIIDLVWPDIKTKQIVIEQLRRFKPEIILFDDTNSSLLKEIIAEIPSIKMVIGWTGSAIANTDIWKYINVVLSCAPESVERLQKLGCKSIHLNHAFEPRINTRKMTTWSFMERMQILHMRESI